MMCAHPRLRLTPLQREILWILEEAGEEHITTLLNTLRSQVSPDQRPSLPDATYEALQALFLTGLVSFEPRIAGCEVNRVSKRPDGIPDFRTLIAWDEPAGYWKWNEDVAGKRRLAFILTDEGSQSLTT